MKMKILTVENQRKYDICFSDGFENLQSAVSNVSGKNQKAFVVTDSNVAPLYLDSVISQLNPCFSEISAFTIPAGEQSKTLGYAQEIIKAMIDKGFNRSDMVIALGGGVVGDLSGFCASVYMRGTDFIQIPTTLVSQIDSSIGGKVAVDMDSYKNMIGSFHNPVLVYENSSCLKTLPRIQFLSGMGEVIKSALLGDENLWSYLLNSLTSGDITEISDEVLIHVLHCVCSIKKRIVEEDPFDKGKRAVLNLGHTIGHAVEKCSDFKITHGACVALGTICASYISFKRGYISQADYMEIYSYINMLGLPVRLPEGISMTSDAVVSAVSKDKKNGPGGLKFILLEKKGSAIIKTDVGNDEILNALEIIKIN